MSFTLSAQITTARLQLTPLRLEMAAPLAAGAGLYAVSQWLTKVPHPYTEADARRFIGANVKNAGKVWAILDETGFVGVIGTLGEFGYWLCPAAQGKGYATEAGQAILNAAFQLPEVDLIQSGYFIENTASANVLRKLGFQPTAPARVFSAARNTEALLQKMQLTRADWQARLR